VKVKVAPAVIAILHGIKRKYQDQSLTALILWVSVSKVEYEKLSGFAEKGKCRRKFRNNTKED
jgi:hypothetical protein